MIAAIKIIEVVFWKAIQLTYFNLLWCDTTSNYTLRTKIVMEVYQCVLPVLGAWILTYVVASVFNLLSRKYDAGISIGVE
jgi:hypothetical protein